MINPRLSSIFLIRMQLLSHTYAVYEWSKTCINFLDFTVSLIKGVIKTE